MRRKTGEDDPPWRRYQFFASPPWATRTLIETVLPDALHERPDSHMSVVEPAAGMGHMSDILAEYFGRVHASDIYPYPILGAGPRTPIRTADFLSADWRGPDCDWIITNPPFRVSDLFLDRALGLARHGVAFLQRMQWLEGVGRYGKIYTRRPPALLAPFAERVPMCEGGFDPEGGTATMYAWFIWRRGADGAWPRPLRYGETLRTFLIPPGRREELSRPSDIALASRCVPGFVPPSQRKGHRRPAAGGPHPEISMETGHV